VTFPDFSVLRGSSRVVSTRWQHPPLICLCRVTVATDDGHGHQVAVSRRVVVFPLRFSVGLLFLALGLGLAQKRLRGRRQQQSAERMEQLRQQAYEQARQEFSGASGGTAERTEDEMT